MGGSRIDLHAHLVPPFSREALRGKGVTSVAGAPFPAWTPPAAMHFMARFGIQAARALLSRLAARVG